MHTNAHAHIKLWLATFSLYHCSTSTNQTTMTCSIKSGCMMLTLILRFMLHLENSCTWMQKYSLCSNVSRKFLLPSWQVPSLFHSFSCSTKHLVTVTPFESLKSAPRAAHCHFYTGASVWEVFISMPNPCLIATCLFVYCATWSDW